MRCNHQLLAENTIKAWLKCTVYLCRDSGFRFTRELACVTLRGTFSGNLTLQLSFLIHILWISRIVDIISIYIYKGMRASHSWWKTIKLLHFWSNWDDTLLLFHALLYNNEVSWHLVIFYASVVQAKTNNMFAKNVACKFLCAIFHARCRMCECCSE